MLNLDLSKVDENFIRKGGFGKIYPYKGKHDQGGLKSVVKCIHADSLTQLFNMMQEVIISFNNSHSGIISSSGYYIEEVKTQKSQEFKLWIRMPRMKQNLADFILERQIINRRLSLKKVVRKTSVLVSALDYLHKRKIAHRDIKPSNMLLDECERIILSDVGSAVVIHDENNSNTLTYGEGTAKYMAPEILRKKGKVKRKKGDVWSLGLTIAQLCEMNLNMEYKDEKERKFMIERMITEIKQTNNNDEDGEALGNILEGMLEWDPEKRLTISTVLEMFKKNVSIYSNKKILLKRLTFY